MTSKKLCKMLKEAVDDENMACRDDYRKIAIKLSGMNEDKDADEISGIMYEECRHKRIVTNLHKKHCGGK